MNSIVDVTAVPYSIEKRLLHVRVGSIEKPAGPNDIKDIKRLFKRALKDVDCRLVVTHHDVYLHVV